MRTELHVDERGVTLGVTPVIFRKYRVDRGGEVVALFPEEAWSADGRTCSCYVHTGQHGEADPSTVIAMTRPATPEEYADLKAELEGPPYNYKLRVCKRLNHTFIATRRIQLREPNDFVSDRREFDGPVPSAKRRA
jgi:hypothetical protein